MKKFLYSFIVLLFIIVCSKVSAYEFGDEVTYNGIKFNVLEENNDSVTLLKSSPLFIGDINNFGYGHVNEYTSHTAGYSNSVTYTKEAVRYYGVGKISYYSSKDCTNIGDKITSGCKLKYDDSEVKYVVDEWTKYIFDKNDLKEDNLGYYARILSKEDVEKSFNFEYVYKTPSDIEMSYAATENTPSWLFNGDFWLMSIADDGQKVYTLNSGSKSLSSFDVMNASGIRPVVTIDKNALSNNSKKEYNYNKDNIKDIFNTKYKVGTVIYYNQTKFYVIYNLITEKEKVIKLIKAEPLTVSEVNKYGQGHINVYTNTPNIVNDINGYGGVAYYSSEQCNTNDTSNCVNEYAKSDIKYIIDNWEEDNLSNISSNLENTQFDYRILSGDDLLNNLYYADQTIMGNTGYYRALMPSSHFDDISVSNCWTDYNYTDSSTSVAAWQEGNTFNSESVYSSSNVICPVITFKGNVDEVIEKPKGEIVIVPDTYGLIKIKIILFGIILISSSIMLVFKYLKKS